MTSKLRPDHEPVVFFLDKCMGRHVVAEALRAAGFTVETHTDHFEQDSPDAEWLPVVAEKGWVVLTKDREFHHNPIEIAALLKSRAASFVLKGKNLTGPQMAQAFLTAMPTIHRFLKKFERPFIARVTAVGRVSIFCTRSDIWERAAPK